MLRQCLWQGKEVNCSEIFTPVITDSGVCCAFNLGSDLKESNYSHLVTEMQVILGVLSFGGGGELANGGVIFNPKRF